MNKREDNVLIKILNYLASNLVSFIGCLLVAGIGAYATLNYEMGEYNQHLISLDDLVKNNTEEIMRLNDRVEILYGALLKDYPWLNKQGYANIMIKNGVPIESANKSLESLNMLSASQRKAYFIQNYHLTESQATTLLKSH